MGPRKLDIHYPAARIRNYRNWAHQFRFSKVVRKQLLKMNMLIFINRYKHWTFIFLGKNRCNSEA